MIVNQAFDDIVQGPGAKFRGNVRGAFKFERARPRKFDRTTDPVRMVGRLGQRIESITAVEQNAESSIALCHRIDGAQTQHLEPRYEIRVGAGLGGKLLELAAVIDGQYGQVFIGPCARGGPMYMRELRVLAQAKFTVARREKVLQFRP